MTDRFMLKSDALKYIESHKRYIDFAKFKVNAYFVTTRGRGKTLLRVEGRITALVGESNGIYANILTPDKVQWSAHISILDPTSLAKIANHLSELCED
jgi:hypothetical protein